MRRDSKLNGYVLSLIGCLGLILAGSARADLTFPVSIQGTIFADGAAPVKVNCRAKNGNRMTFLDADITVDSFPVLTIDSSCGLHSDQGVFADGERFNGELIDEVPLITTILDKRGTERFLAVVLQESIGSGSGNLDIILSYAATFFRDKNTGLLVAPMRGAKGQILLVNDSTGEIFIGKWKTGRPF